MPTPVSAQLAPEYYFVMPPFCGYLVLPPFFKPSPLSIFVHPSVAELVFIGAVQMSASPRNGLWNRLLARAEDRAHSDHHRPSAAASEAAPTSPSASRPWDAHLRVSLENGLIYHGLTISSRFDLPLQRPPRKRKSRQSAVPTESAARSRIIPTAERLRNDRAATTSPGPSHRTPTSTPARRISKSTPLSRPLFTSDNTYPPRPLSTLATASRHRILAVVSDDESPPRCSTSIPRSNSSVEALPAAEARPPPIASGHSTAATPHMLPAADRNRGCLRGDDAILIGRPMRVVHDDSSERSPDPLSPMSAPPAVRACKIHFDRQDNDSPRNAPLRDDCSPLEKPGQVASLLKESPDASASVECHRGRSKVAISGDANPSNDSGSAASVPPSIQQASDSTDNTKMSSGTETPCEDREKCKEGRAKGRFREEKKSKLDQDLPGHERSDCCSPQEDSFSDGQLRLRVRDESRGKSKATEQKNKKGKIEVSAKRSDDKKEIDKIFEGSSCNDDATTKTDEGKLWCARRPETRMTRKGQSLLVLGRSKTNSKDDESMVEHRVAGKISSGVSAASGRKGGGCPESCANDGEEEELGVTTSDACGKTRRSKWWQASSGGGNVCVNEKISKVGARRSGAKKRGRQDIICESVESGGGKEVCSSVNDVVGRQWSNEGNIRWSSEESWEGDEVVVEIGDSKGGNKMQARCDKKKGETNVGRERGRRRKRTKVSDVVGRAKRRRRTAKTGRGSPRASRAENGVGCGVEQGEKSVSQGSCHMAAGSKLGSPDAAGTTRKHKHCVVVDVKKDDLLSDKQQMQDGASGGRGNEGGGAELETEREVQVVCVSSGRKRSSRRRSFSAPSESVSPRRKRGSRTKHV